MSNRRSIARWFRPWIAAAIVACAPFAAAQDGSTDEARTLFLEGAKLAKAKRWEEARDHYQRSLDKRRAAITLYSLGVAQKECGRFAAAIESFTAFLREPSGPKTAPYEAPARAAITELEAKVGHVILEIVPPDAEGLVITIDNVKITFDAPSAKRPLDPGSHEVLAVATNRKEARALVAVTKGSAATVRLQLDPKPLPEPPPSASAPPPPPSASAPPASASALPPPPPSSAKAPSRALPIALMSVGGGVAVIGLSVGIAGFVQARGAPQGENADVRAARIKGIAGDVLMGVGLGTGIAGLIVLLTTPSKPPSGVSYWSPTPVGAGVATHF